MIRGLAMDKQTPKDELEWIYGNADLGNLMERYPEIWRGVGPELVAAVENGRAETLQSFSAKAKSAEDLWLDRIRKSRGNTKVIESAIPHLVKSRLALLSMDKCCQAAAMGKASGKIRFNRINGYIIQKLLFSRRLERKPAALRWFRFWWRFVSQKRYLMPLVQPKGIYCFYTRELVAALGALVGDRTCLEIGAGDGTLSRFLRDRGIRIQATDDHSWTHTIRFPQEVERLDARQALERYQPAAVLCSWPPPGNRFEQRVFSTRSVDIYIVIGSRYPFASGNWDSYRAQKEFDFTIDRNLSALVIPPELESAVLVFRRLKTGT
jgi:hypothetical protein